LVLGGVEIPFEYKLAGYSDADVLVHAIIDALLGATASGDIGTHFPPGDLRYKSISSIILLRRVGKSLRQQGWQIGNIDNTVVAERPQLSKFIDRMREQIAHALGIDKGQVSVKAKTSPGAESTPRAGISAHAVALVERESGGEAPP
jgi:2-C-methyl-D-erythritol 2,4-cyclodiphosphate synthase